MGLAVLPSRLKDELALLADYIVEGKDIRSEESIAKHADWVEEFLPKYAKITKDNVMEILQDEVGHVSRMSLRMRAFISAQRRGVRHLENLSRH